MTNVALVTGGSGFIGSRALPVLVGRGYEVHAVSSRERDDADGVRWHTADLLDPAATAAVMQAVGPTHLLHLAWYTEPSRYWSSVENVRWLEASLALLRAFAAQRGGRIVLAGTCAEYDWSGGTCSEKSTPMRPATLYASAKHALHVAGAGLAAEAGLSLGWARVFFLYGPGEHPSRLVSSVARALIAGEPADTSDGSRRRDFLHVDDVAGAVAALLDSAVAGPVNVGSGRAVSIGHLVELVAQRTGRPELVRVGARSSAPTEAPLVEADVRRLTDEVGYAPRWTLEEGVHQTVAWWEHRLRP